MRQRWRQAAGDAGEQVGGEPRDADPGQHDEP